jgi:GDP-mannose 6-dehydrogenase
MRISVFGIGYVGAVSAGCLARDGHFVVAVDPNADKVATLNAGRSPILEPGLGAVISEQVQSGRLKAIGDPRQAIKETNVSFVCVGTPSRFNGSLDTGYVLRAAEEIGRAIADKDDFHTVVFRSTVLPGTIGEVAIPALARASGKRPGIDFGVGYHPEFLRESTAIRDYDEPGTVIIGALEPEDSTVKILREINAAMAVEPSVVAIKTAEAIKYVNNCWHALKVSFSNEIGNICKASGIDSHEVMEILCADTRLNISTAYMKPGFAFGGSCLPKDLRAIRFRARELDVPTPVLDATLAANEVQLRRAYDMVAQIGSRRVGIVGLSFKSNTDDLRESPMVELAERLYGKGFDLRIFDPEVRYSSLVGANLHYVRSHIPHLSSLLEEDLESVCNHAEVLVIGKRDSDAVRAVDLTRGKAKVVDLVRLAANDRSSGGYDGICW